MHRTLYPIVFGALLLLLHTIFPPRVLFESESGLHNRAGRANLFDDFFYVQFRSESGEVVSRLQVKEGATIERLALDWDLFVTQSIMILCVTILIAAVVALLRATNSNKMGEQGGDGDAEEAV